MNHKQKLGYILLGAGIMAVGITIGQFITPDIEAQSNGVFNEITCRKLTVVDTAGKDAIVLNATRFTRHNQIVLFNTDGKEAVTLNSAGDYNGILVHNHKGEAMIGLTSAPIMNLMFITDPLKRDAFKIHAYPERNELIVYEKSSAAGIGFYSDSNEAKQITWTHD